MEKIRFPLLDAALRQASQHIVIVTWELSCVPELPLLGHVKGSRVFKKPAQ